MIKAKLWQGNDLKGVWLFTLKVDGVRGLKKEDGTVVSRKGKPLHNLDHVPYTDFEVYTGSWETTVSDVRTHKGEPVALEHIYSLDPIDERLCIGNVDNPTKEYITARMERAVKDGYEGLVLRQGGKWFKVKPKETYDVVVTGLQEGKNKNVGKLGAFLTDTGNVGTGFTDVQREQYFDEKYIGSTIEVDCMGLTPKGKFRHPRFIRERFDK